VTTLRISTFWRNPLRVLSLFLAMHLWARGLPWINSALLALWFFSNAIVGAWIYAKAIKKQRPNIYELIFVGSSIGIVLHAIIDQLFVAFDITGITSRLIILSAAIIILAGRDVITTSVTPSSTHAPNILFAILISVMTVMASLDHYSSISLVVIIIASVLSNLKQLRNASYQLLVFAVFLSAVVHNYLLNRSLEIGKHLLPLITGSDDQIKTEQLAWSLANWGLQTRSSAIDVPIKFHWLSLAWSGSISTGLSPQPFLVTLHFVPLVGFLLIAISGTALAFRISKLPLLWFVAPAILITTSGYLEKERFFFVLTTTNLIPHIFVITLFFLLLNHLESNGNLINQLLLILMPSLILLGKGPYSVSVLFAVATLFVGFRISFIDKIQNILVLLLSASFAFATYWIFIKSPFSDGYIISIDHIVKSFPSPLFSPQVGSEFLRIILAVMVFGGFLLFRFPVLYLNSYFQLPKDLTRFFLGGFAALLLSFIAYQSGSETYFMNAALTLSALANIYLLDRVLIGISTSPTAVNRRLFFSIFLFLILAGSVYARIHQPIFFKYMPLVLQWFLLFSVFALLINWFKANSHLFVLSLIIVPVLLGISNIQISTIVKQNNIISHDEIVLYEFIRANLPKDAVIATNRELCRQIIDCDIGQGMPVSAAFSQRQFLIEGSRSFLPTKYWKTKYPFGLQARVDATHTFIDSPSNSSKQVLLDWRVQWIIIKSPSNPLILYEAFADIVYKSGDFYLLSLHK
jgi:hypothetical protein